MRGPHGAPQHGRYLHSEALNSLLFGGAGTAGVVSDTTIVCASQYNGCVTSRVAVTILD